tara:strand:- start:162 stop:515 length:354 start_codon:yes stop_codon:yes gene_type:complete
MARGLFKSIYGKTDEGIFPELYSHEGTTSKTKRMDIRLAGWELGQVEDDEDDEEDEEEEIDISASVPPSGGMKLPTAPGGAVTAPSVFTQEKEGFPMWVLGIFILGFALAWRQNKKA